MGYSREIKAFKSSMFNVSKTAYQNMAFMLSSNVVHTLTIQKLSVTKSHVKKFHLKSDLSSVTNRKQIAYKNPQHLMVDVLQYSVLPSTFLK